MKGFLKFVAIFAGILLLSSLLAPLLFDFLPFKFEKIFNRLVMIGSFLAIAIFVRIRKPTLVLFGMDWRKESPRLFLTGFLTAIVVLVLFTATEMLAGNAFWSVRQMSWWGWARKILSCLGSALLIGVLEEFFFRGFIFTALRDKLCRGRVFFAMFLTSVFYSSVHFVNIRKPLISPDPTFLDSLKLLAAPFQSFADWQQVWPAAVGLFLFGMVLNDAAVRSRSLYASIGLHAGCVLFVRTVGLWVGFLEKNVFFWSTKKVYDGVMGWLFLFLIGFLLRLFLKKAEPASATAHPLT